MNYAVWAALVLLAAARPAAAGFIRLVPELAAVPENGEVVVRGTIANRGDEAARDVGLKVSDGAGRGGIVAATLEPDAAVAVAWPAAPWPEAPGEHVLPLLVTYRDANGYPFSAVHPLSVTAGEAGPAPARLAGVLRVLTLHGDAPGEAVLGLKNLSGEECEARVQLLLPDELSGDAPDRRVVVYPGKRAEVRFPVENFSALPGSTYAAAALVTCDDGGRQRALTVTGLVRIQAAQAGFPAGVLVGVAALLVAAFVFVQWRGRRA